MPAVIQRRRWWTCRSWRWFTGVSVNCRPWRQAIRVAPAGVQVEALDFLCGGCWLGRRIPSISTGTSGGLRDAGGAYARSMQACCRTVRLSVGAVVTEASDGGWMVFRRLSTNRIRLGRALVYMYEGGWLPSAEELCGGAESHVRPGLAL